MTERIPAEAFPVGEYIKEELEARGWSQADLAEVLGRPIPAINEIISGKRGISPETANGLAAAFGTSAEYWMNLDVAYQLWKLRRDKPEDNAVSRRSKLYGIAPVNYMVKRGWISNSRNVEVLEKQVLDFFEIDNLDQMPPSLTHAARKSTPYQVESPVLKAWLYRAKHLSRMVDVDPYRPEAFPELIHNLRELLLDHRGVGKANEVLAGAGIRFVVIEHLPKTKIDGACLWLEGESPVIALSLRYDRLDWFWHTLFHELGHLKNQDQSMDIDLGGESTGGSEKPPAELAADAFAASTLVPQDKLEEFIKRVRPMFSKKRIQEFADSVGLHPGIVVGQLQHRDEINYAHSRDLLVKIRSIVTSSTVTDGWGYTQPVVA